MYSKVILVCLMALASATSYNKPYVQPLVTAEAEPEPEPVNIDYKMSMYVQDDPSYNYQTREESKDGQIIKGQYTVLEPTGELRIVKYYADETGFHADVQNQANYGKPYKAPEPTYRQAAPAYAQAAPAAPAYAQSAPAAPAYAQSAPAAPAYAQAAPAAPAYAQSAPAAPAYAQAAPAAPAYAQPIPAAAPVRSSYDQESESVQESSSGYDQSSDSQNHYGASAFAQTPVVQKSAPKVKVLAPVVHQAAVPVPQMIFFQSAPRPVEPKRVASFVPKPVHLTPTFNKVSHSAPAAHYEEPNTQHQEDETGHNGY